MRGVGGTYAQPMADVRHTKPTLRSWLTRRKTLIDLVLIALLVFFTIRVIRNGDWVDVAFIVLIFITTFTIARNEKRRS